MANLLPEPAKTRIRSEYRSRFILSGAFLAMAVALFTILALLPSYGVLYMTRPSALVQVSRAMEGKSDQEDIAKAQMLVVQLGPVAAASSSASTAILDALEMRPSGVHVDSISYVAGQNAVISIGGVATGRETMDKYRTALQSDPRFTAVKLPVGDLVGSKGGRFTITIGGKF